MTQKPLVRYSTKTVLIIEDFAEFASALRSMMISLGSKVIDIVYNGEDAIEACRVRKFDIILSDTTFATGKMGSRY